MPEKDSYMEEAYEMLKHMSVDERSGWNTKRVKKQSGTIIHRCKG